MGPVELSVVLPVRDADGTIGEQLEALVGQDWERRWEVVVVDNRSRDRTRAIVSEYMARDARLRLVDASEQLGVAYCRNIGIAAARGRAVAFCDADDVVAPGWVRAMGDALAVHEFVTGRLDIDRLNPLWLVESRGRRIERHAFRFGALFDFANGCNSGIRRELIETLGGFDQRFLGGEDIEFSFRAWQAGISVHYVEDALVHYRYRQSTGALWRQARAYGRAYPALVDAVRRAGYAVADDQELRRWLWLLRHLRIVRTESGRAYWVSVAGGRYGRLEGKVRQRSHDAASVFARPVRAVRRHTERC